MSLREMPPYSTLSDTASLLRVEPGPGGSGSGGGACDAGGGAETGEHGAALVTVDECLERIGTGRFHVIAVIICGLGNAADAVELMAIGYILPQMQHVGPADKAMLSAAVFLGMLVGGLVSGRVSDRLGRKTGMLTCVRARARGREMRAAVCLLLLLCVRVGLRREPRRSPRSARRRGSRSMAVNAFFALLSAFMTTWYGLLICRVFAGLGVGGSIPILFALYIEYLPVRRRGFFVTIVAWFWMLGTIFASGLAWLMMAEMGLSWQVRAAAAAARVFACTPPPRG